MLAPTAQKYLTSEFYEYPLAEGIPVSRKQISLKQLQPPRIDLSQLSDLKGTLSLLQEADVL